MPRAFADTFHWIALEAYREPWHAQARALTRRHEGDGLVTTEEVLVEFLAWFSGAGAYWRQRAARQVQTILSNPQIEVVQQSHSSFVVGLALYERRLDKEYSLVDCVGMAVMRQYGLTEVLTRDRHFAQEGFTLLYADPSP